MIIQSAANPMRYARLVETGEGVEVSFMRITNASQPTRGRRLDKVECREVIDAPFHLVCDHVHDLIEGE